MKHDSSKLIDQIGGNAAVSRIFSISSQAVSKWRKTGIPAARLMYLKLANPEIFATQTEKKAA